MQAVTIEEDSCLSEPFGAADLETTNQITEVEDAAGGRTEGTGKEEEERKGAEEEEEKEEEEDHESDGREEDEEEEEDQEVTSPFDHQ
ncbi:F-box/WD repeat-containing protein 7-like isoform X1, partial [Scomber scombrus]